MKGNKKYIYICLVVAIIAILGYVVIDKINVLNKENVKKVEVAKTEVGSNDELLNSPNVNKLKEDNKKTIKSELEFDMLDDISKKDIRKKLSDNIVIAKVTKIAGASNVNPKNGEETLIRTQGELEILK